MIADTSLSQLDGVDASTASADQSPVNSAAIESESASAALAPGSVTEVSRMPYIAWAFPQPITADEWASARLSPDCLVEDYLFADVAVIVAPGGSGKTTLLLYESIHIALGLPLYGLEVRKAGSVLIVTAEDSRDILVARLRLMAEAMHLNEDQMATVKRSVRISDVSGRGVKLTTLVNDIVVPAALADSIIADCRDREPVLVAIDPAVSFGIGESRVNDAEQGLVEAARRIRSGLNCCVRFVHHTGKQNARGKAVDQYAGRGGSTMPDGARMVAVLQPLTPQEWRAAAGKPLADGESGMVLTRPKLSYAAPQPDILIARQGYTFAHTRRVVHTKTDELEARCTQVLRLIEMANNKGERPSKKSIEATNSMPRDDLRGALATLESRGAIEEVAIMPAPVRGQRSYLTSCRAKKVAQSGAR